MDVVNQNADLYRQDLEAQFARYMIPPPDTGVEQPQSQEIDAQLAHNEIDVPDPLTPAVDVDPEEIIPGSSGVEHGEAE